MANLYGIDTYNGSTNLLKTKIQGYEKEFQLFGINSVTRSFH